MQVRARCVPGFMAKPRRASIEEGKAGAGVALALLLFGCTGFVAAERLSSETGKLLIVGAASLAMLLPAVAVLLIVRALGASPAAPSASEESSGAMSPE